MKHFTDFVHLINTEKKFVFELVPKENTTANPMGDGTYNYDFPAYDKKKLKYNGYTFEQFQNYINEIKSLIRNEVSDVFHKENKDQLVEIHNKFLLLIKLISNYKTLKTSTAKKYNIYTGMSFRYPDSDISEFKELAEYEKKQISQFMKLEFDTVYETIELIRKLEEDYKYEHIVGKFDKIEGFIFNSPKSIDLVNIYSILNDHLLQTDLKTFLKAFQGQELKSSPKIRWLLKNRNGSISMYALIYFLEHPIFIEQTEKEIIRKIDYIFVDSEGKSFIGRISQNLRHFKNDRVSIYSKNYNEKWKKIVDERINKICEYL